MTSFTDDLFLMVIFVISGCQLSIQWRHQVRTSFLGQHQHFRRGNQRNHLASHWGWSFERKGNSHTPAPGTPSTLGNPLAALDCYCLSIKTKHCLINRILFSFYLIIRNSCVLLTGDYFRLVWLSAVSCLIRILISSYKMSQLSFLVTIHQIGILVKRSPLLDA